VVTCLNDTVGPRPTIVQLPGIGDSAFEIVLTKDGDRATICFRGILTVHAIGVLRAVVSHFAHCVSNTVVHLPEMSREDNPAGLEVHSKSVRARQPEGNAELLIADAVDILRTAMPCDPNRAFEALYDSAARNGLSVEAAAAAVVARALRSSDGPVGPRRPNRAGPICGQSIPVEQP
jgi:hypothetical protein